MYKKVLIILLVVFWAVSALADMVVDTAWVRRYNGSGDSWDIGHAVAVDGSRNVYVAGQSFGNGTDWDYATTKYYPNGDTAWVRRYNGPADSADVARAIAIDGLGNVYVTGYSIGIATGYDYATIKYYPNGDTAWVRRYNGPGNGRDEACAIAVDLSNNVFVTGSSEWDYLTIKYYPNGDTAWVRRYDGPGNGGDYASAIAVDGYGNVCITGGSTAIESYFGYATIKYDPSGNQLWATRYDTVAVPGLGAYAHAIKIDDSGNVYVTGWCDEEVTAADYATIKYDPYGNQLWIRKYNGPANGVEEGNAIAVDGSNNVYVTGYSRGSDRSNDYATVKYDPNGNQLWVTRYNGPENGEDRAYAIALDSSGNVYVTGTSTGSGTNYDYATIKYVQADALRGDANKDGVINSTDVVYLINYLFIGGPAPEPWQAGDANCDGAINSSDAVYLINYLFIGGPPPGC